MHCFTTKNIDVSTFQTWVSSHNSPLKCMYELMWFENGFCTLLPLLFFLYPLLLSSLFLFSTLFLCLFFLLASVEFLSWFRLLSKWFWCVQPVKMIIHTYISQVPNSSRYSSSSSLAHQWFRWYVVEWMRVNAFFAVWPSFSPLSVKEPYINCSLSSRRSLGYCTLPRPSRFYCPPESTTFCIISAYFLKITANFVGNMFKTSTSSSVRIVFRWFYSHLPTFCFSSLIASICRK